MDQNNNNKTQYEPPVKGWLTLKFSESSDQGRILDYVEPDNTADRDPDGYIARRDASYLQHAINNGGAIYIEDENGDIHGLAIGYNINYKSQPMREIGTTFAPLRGYKTAALLVSALSLKMWWDDTEDRIVACDVKKSNIGSLRVFDGLGWYGIEDPALAKYINSAADQSLDNADKDPGLDEYNYLSAPNKWFMQTPAALSAAAQLLLDTMDTHKLRSKHSDTELNIDLSAIEDAGLSMSVLKEIANGNVDKTMLKQIQDAKPSADQHDLHNRPPPSP